MIDRWNGAGASTRTKSTQWDSSWPGFVDDPRRNEVLSYFENRFGISLSTFDGLVLLERPQAYWLLTDCPHVRDLGRLKIHTAGIPALRKMQRHLKPTTTAIQIFGTKATKNIVDLDREQITHVLSQHRISLSLRASPGYIILSYDQHILGCGLYTGSLVLSQIPHSYVPR